MLSKFRHPNLVLLLGFARAPGKGYLVYEFLDGGDVRSVLQKAADAGKAAAPGDEGLFPCARAPRHPRQLDRIGGGRNRGAGCQKQGLTIIHFLELSHCWTHFTASKQCSTQSETLLLPPSRVG